MGRDVMKTREGEETRGSDEARQLMLQGPLISSPSTMKLADAEDGFMDA